MNYERFRNKLVVFEGADCTGKTSVARLLNKHLNENGIDSLFTFQPGDTSYGPIASLLRSFCIDKRWGFHDMTNFFLFLADKSEQMSKVVIPALEKGQTVICDRWWFSTYAYQFYGKEILEKWGLSEALGDWLNTVSVLKIVPDVTYYFPETLNVNRDRDGNDQFETMQEDFKVRVHNAYEKLASKYGFIRVLPGNSVEDTLNKIIERRI